MDAGAGLTLGLAGDVMLGRGVARGLEVFGPDHALGAVAPLWEEADLRLANLACVLTSRRTRGEDKLVYCRGEPRHVESLRRAGIHAVTLANDRVLDYGGPALADTLGALDAAGVAHTGAGCDLAAAERPVRALRNGWRVSVLAFADRPAAWAAGPTAPGIRYLPLDSAGLEHARAALAAERRHADIVVVSLHEAAEPRPRPDPALRRFAHRLVEAGADVVWGHGAHVVQGVEWVRGRPVLYDTGDLVSDSAVDEVHRNDLGGLFLVRVVPGRIAGVEVVPTRIRGARAEPAEALERDRWLARLAERCRELGTRAEAHGGRLALSSAAPELVG